MDDHGFGPLITIHGLERCFDRYGFLPTVDEVAEAFLSITDRTAIRAKFLRGRLEEWIVRMRGRDVRVVYSPDAACIITVVPLSGRSPVTIEETRKMKPRYVRPWGKRG